MAKTYDIKVNAASPNLPLQPLYVFVNSPTSPRIINVPKRIGQWALTKVYIAANLPDGTLRTVEMANSGGCFVGTLPPCSTVGASANGFQVIADGTDETGASMTGYTLGHGDLIVLPREGEIHLGETPIYFHLLDAVPESPHRGDSALISGTLKWYDGEAWQPFGGGGGGGSVAWADITDKPETFPPSSHNHTTSEITDFPTAMPPTAHTHTKSEITDFQHQHPSDDIVVSADANFTAWEFSGATSSYQNLRIEINHVGEEEESYYSYELYDGDELIYTNEYDTGEELSVSFSGGEITASRDRIALASQLNGKLDKTGGTVDGEITLSDANGWLVVEHSFTRVIDGVENKTLQSYLNEKADKTDFGLDETTGVPSAEYVQSLFSKDDTSDPSSLELKNKVLQDSIDARIKNAVSPLDPDTASVYDIITALKGE